MFHFIFSFPLKQKRKEKSKEKEKVKKTHRTIKNVARGFDVSKRRKAGNGETLDDEISSNRSPSENCNDVNEDEKQYNLLQNDVETQAEGN